MFRLLRIEARKAISRKIFLAALIICSVLTIGFGWFLSVDLNLEGEKSVEEIEMEQRYERAEDWKQRLRVEMEMNQYTASVFGQETIDMKNALLQYRIDNDLEPYEKNTVWNFISYTYQILNSMLSIFAVIFIIDIVAMEFTNRTIKLLYTKPYSRCMLLSSKYLAGVTFTLILSVVIVFVAYIVGGVFFSFDGAFVKCPVYFWGEIYTLSAWGESLVYFYSAVLKALIMMTVAFFIAIITQNQIASTLISLGLLFFGSNLSNKLLERGMEWVRFTLFINSDLNEFINQPIDRGDFPILTIGVVIVHVVILYWASMHISKRQDI